MEFLEIVARPLLLLARFLLWLAWDLLFLTIAWTIGWPIVRALSLGRFPHVGIREYDDSGTGEAIIVCGVGFGVLVGAVWWLARHTGFMW